MAVFPPRDLAAAATVSDTDVLIVDKGSSVEKALPSQIVDAAIPLASQAEAEAGTNNDKRVTPLRVAQAIAALGISESFLSGDDGATKVGYKAPGVGSILRTAEDNFNDIVTRPGYSTTAAAITAAIADDFVVAVLDDLTVNIPSDAATLQIALDRLTPLNQKCIITLNIESGHSLAEGVLLVSRNCAQFHITSDDATVPVSFNGDIIQGFKGAVGPGIYCKIDAASQTSGNGIDLSGSHIFVEEDCGVINAWGSGLRALYGSSFSANGADFSGAARNGVTEAGITCWGSFGSAEQGDCTDSGYYGCQAAHGGVLMFRQGDASGAYRHGIRATDTSVVDADSAVANNCGADGSGSNVRAYEGGRINFTNGTANGNLATDTNGAALFAYGNGLINAPGVTSTGNARYGGYAERNSTIITVGGTVAGATASFRNIDSVIISETIGDTNGSYAPTVTPVTNITGTPTVVTAQFQRVGNVITVSGVVQNIATTAAGNATVRLPPPIASNLASTSELAGTAVFYTGTLKGTSVAIFASAATDLAEFSWTAPAASTGQAMSFTFTYLYRAP